MRQKRWQAWCLTAAMLGAELLPGFAPMTVYAAEETATASNAQTAGGSQGSTGSSPASSFVIDPSASLEELFAGTEIATASNALVLSLNGHHYLNGVCMDDGCTDPYLPAEEDTEGILQITNAGNLFWLNDELAASDGADYEVALANDISLQVDFTKLIWESKSTFSGSFYGNGHTISGLCITEAGEEGTGLFAKLSGAYLSDLTLADVKIMAGADHTGALAGYAEDSDLQYVTVSGIIEGGNATGGLVGSTDNATFYECVCSAEIASDGSGIGGIVGYAEDSSYIENGTFEGWIHSLTGDADFMSGIGGIAGVVDGSTTIDYCFQTGRVEGAMNVGGIAGFVNDGSIMASANQGTISTLGTAGGIAAVNSENGFIETCFQTGHILAADGSRETYLGGIAGISSGEIYNCFSIGRIDAVGIAGGLVGEMAEEGTLTTGYNYYMPTGSDAEVLQAVAGLVSEDASVTAIFYYEGSDDCEDTEEISFEYMINGYLANVLDQASGSADIWTQGSGHPVLQDKFEQQYIHMNDGDTSYVEQGVTVRIKVPEGASINLGVIQTDTDASHSWSLVTEGSSEDLEESSHAIRLAVDYDMNGSVVRCVTVRANGTKKTSGFELTVTRTEEPEEEDPVVYAIEHSVSLHGRIGLNYYVKPQPETVLTGAELHAADNTYYPDAEDAGDGFYKFSVELPAAMLTEVVTLQLTGETALTADGSRGSTLRTVTSKVYSYSVQEYAETILKDHYASYSDELKTVVADLLSYGGQAQRFFGINTDAYADANLESLGWPVTLDASVISSDAKSSMSSPAANIYARYKGHSLSLASDTALVTYVNAAARVNKANLYLACQFAGESTVTYVPFSESNGELYASIEDIPAPHLVTMAKLWVCEKKNDSYNKISYVNTYSPECYALLASKTSNKLLKNVAISLITYGKAAAEYFYD